METRVYQTIWYCGYRYDGITAKLYHDNKGMPGKPYVMPTKGWNGKITKFMIWAKKRMYCMVENIVWHQMYGMVINML